MVRVLYHRGHFLNVKMNEKALKFNGLGAFFVWKIIEFKI